MGTKFKVAITDSNHPDHKPESEVLSRLGADLVQLDCRTEDDIIRNCKDFDALLNQFAPITRKVFQNLPRLKIVARYGVGVDNIDLKAATERRVFVTNVVFDISEVADHAAALILTVIRKIPWADNDVKQGLWDWKRYQPISAMKGLTVGIVGFGRIGAEVAKRILPFGAKVIAYDPYVLPEYFKKMSVTAVNLPKLLETSDVVTLHLSLTDKTHHMIGEKELRKMKKTAILVNVSRGSVIDEEALYRALKESRISCAALDVMEKEPPDKGNPLSRLHNVIATPHMAWYSTKSLTEIKTKAAQEIARVLSGEAPLSLVNKEVLA